MGPINYKNCIKLYLARTKHRLSTCFIYQPFLGPSFPVTPLSVLNLAWGKSPPPEAPVARAPMTANNVIFLIPPQTSSLTCKLHFYILLIATSTVFGMFLMATLLPVLVATLIRVMALTSILFLVAAVTNPSDQSFAQWVSQQNEPSDLVPDASIGMSKWISAVYKTAKALVQNDSLTWRFYNVLIFSVVYVPTRERYAFGVFGIWRWADEYGDVVKSLCQSPWVLKVSRGGILSSMDRYQVIESASDSANLHRQRRDATPSGFQDVETASHRRIRAKALQCKVRKDWQQAAMLFADAAKVATALVIQASYELEAAWCSLEILDTFPSSQNGIFQTIRSVCDALASAGYFDEAARGVSELALRLKRKFPKDCKTVAKAKDVAELYVLAKDIAEAGGNGYSAAEYGLYAARVYADAGLWSLAETCFEAVGGIRRENGQNELANEAYGNAVLCHLSRLDFVSAEEKLHRYSKLLGEISCSSDMNLFLSSVLRACKNWSVQLLDEASERYDSKHRLAPWQRECIGNLKEKLSNADLR
ncbi:hypothetical protein CCR75_000050 [Bremia lactucae]|uniref:Uncharacterized protein n=1 Tax=Bremia lactucae TaxID=4779 RepID=A0A976FIB8_BRELC|nr:hypothetical protein CCR75_000050 [Bremia lactucae]